MDEINSLIFHGCKLARVLELNLPALSNDPGFLLKSCDEIVRVFGGARDRLNSQGSTSNAGQTSHELEMAAEIGGGMVEEWLRYGGGSQAMSLLLQTQLLADDQGRLGGRDVEGSTRFGGGGGEAQPMDVADSGGGASSSLRSRRRRNDLVKRTVMMPAPRMGNTEIPEDGYTWRKYCQKEILGSTFPRSYYRCTHSKLYDCQAKKQVQRLDNNPFTFAVTYRGDHTCHMSSTAPSASPAPAAELMPPSHPQAPTRQLATTTASPPPPAAFPLGRPWLSMDFGLGSSGAGPSSGGGGAGPSSIRFGRDTMEFPHPVADLADVMFNSGSSSSE